MTHGLAPHLLDLERIDLLRQFRHLVLALLQLALLPLAVLLLRFAVLLLQPDAATPMPCSQKQPTRA